MIFLSGPRQIGKTTFAAGRLKETGEEFLYFNWDDPYVRREYTRNPHFLKAVLAKSQNPHPIVLFDEIHKHKNWKNILKGLYDIHREEAQLMITGSARLDYLRSSGDSLVGRYFSYRMLPLGLVEAAQEFRWPFALDRLISRPDEEKLLARLDRFDEKKFGKAFRRLLEYGGFPEPFLKADPAFSVKWRRDYRSLLTREDLRDMTRIHDVKGIEQLLMMLPERVGSPLSLNSLREDLLVNHKTVANWLEGLKKVYLVFSITPWSKKIVRALTKEPKVYFYDWTFVQNPGARFENLTAVMLLRMTGRWNELGLGEFDLRYVRTRHKEEVDFLVTKDNRPFALFEAKTGETGISKAAHRLSDVLGVPYYQLVSDADVMEAYPDNRYVISAWRFFAIIG